MDGAISSAVCLVEAPILHLDGKHVKMDVPITFLNDLDGDDVTCDDNAYDEVEE